MRDCDTPNRERADFIAKWQHILGLDTWRILSLTADEEICGDMGCDNIRVEFNTTTQTATIYIKPESERTMVTGHGFNEEIAIIHELLHLFFAFYPDYQDGTVEGRYFDNRVEQLAKVLYKVSDAKQR